MSMCVFRCLCVSLQGINLSQLLNRQKVKSRLENVFTRHGAVVFDLPLMLPKMSMYELYTQSVTFMDHAGNLVSLPYDLRVSLFTIYTCDD